MRLARRHHPPSPTEVTDEQAVVPAMPSTLIPATLAGSRACCCGGWPQYQVLVPGSETEILFCRRHFAAHEDQLRRLDAAVYDAWGWQLHLWPGTES